MVGFDELQPFVHQGGGIDGYLGTHRPIRVLARLRGRRDAVRTRRTTSSRRPALKAWNSALCSESTGSTVVPFCAARRMNKAPAQTRHSLLASATVPPRSTAASVG